jgi:hypothetical protein
LWKFLHCDVPPLRRHLFWDAQWFSGRFMFTNQLLVWALSFLVTFTIATKPENFPVVSSAW